MQEGNRMGEIPKVFKDLEKVSELIPVPLYWINKDGVYLGGNKLCLVETGAKSPSEFIGKRWDEVHKKEIADKIIENIKLVMNTGKVVRSEEVINDLSTGKQRYYMAIRLPVYDENNVIAGIVATSIEISDTKEAESLRLETELQKTKLDEQEQFRKVVDQVVHDIRSPLASLLMVVKSSEKDIPEITRVALREAAISIGDIANQLLSKYENEALELSGGSRVEEPQPIMVVLTILQLLSEKKHQYKELPINFSYSFSPESNFAFIQAAPIAFKRMLSNIINNAVEAIEGKSGMVSLQLFMENKSIKVVIQDDGKGMAQEVVDKIMGGVAVTSNKKDGHGIGFVQIRETLERNYGQLAVDSKVGKGTKITLAFPIVATPAWIAKEIKLNKGDTVIILDDDSSIHSAWKTHFKKYNKDIALKHFVLGEDAISFINNFSQKEKIFLLTDFELLKQELNGLHVIERTGIKRAVLVTSHYSNSIIRNIVIKSGAKILPKSLASEIPVEIAGDNDNVDISNKPTVDGLGKVDAVLVDDDRMFINSLAMFFESNNKRVNKYYNTKKFLENLHFYAKDVKIFMDNNFNGCVDGIGIAKKLHGMGYTKLYLLSGTRISVNEVPDYLTPVLKTDLDKILILINE